MWGNGEKKERSELHQIGQFLKDIRDILQRLAPAPARSLVAQISDGGIPMGAPATIHVNSSTAQANFQEFDGPNGTGNKVPPIGPMAFASDNLAVLTIDAATGKITPVSVGSANVSVTDTGNGLTDSVACTVTAAVAQSLVASVTP